MAVLADLLAADDGRRHDADHERNQLETRLGGAVALHQLQVQRQHRLRWVLYDIITLDKEHLVQDQQYRINTVIMLNPP